MQKKPLTIQQIQLKISDKVLDVYTGFKMVNT